MGFGVRLPVGSRLAASSASLSRGTTSGGKLTEESILLGDCTPWTHAAYGGFAVDGEELESGRKRPFGRERFIRGEKRNIDFCSLRYGEKRKPDRLCAFGAAGRLRESHPELRKTSLAVIHGNR